MHTLTLIKDFFGGGGFGGFTIKLRILINLINKKTNQQFKYTYTVHIYIVQSQRKIDYCFARGIEEKINWNKRKKRNRQIDRN